MRAGRALVALYLSISCTVLADPFRLDNTIIGYQFADAFQWWSNDDPTHGRVNYVDKDTAFQKNLFQKNLSYGTSFRTRPLSGLIVYITRPAQCPTRNLSCVPTPFTLSRQKQEVVTVSGYFPMLRTGMPSWFSISITCLRVAQPGQRSGL
jgi:hypothetical protein